MYVNYQRSKTHSLVPSYVWPYMALFDSSNFCLFDIIVYHSACCSKLYTIEQCKNQANQSKEQANYGVAYSDTLDKETINVCYSLCLSS